MLGYRGLEAGGVRLSGSLGPGGTGRMWFGPSKITLCQSFVKVFHGVSRFGPYFSNFRDSLHLVIDGHEFCLNSTQYKESSSRFPHKVSRSKEAEKEPAMLCGELDVSFPISLRAATRDSRWLIPNFSFVAL